LLDSERLSTLLAELREQYDHIIVATVLTPPDAAALAASLKCAGIVAVGELGKDTVRGARKAAEAFTDAGVPVIAAVALASVARSNGRAKHGGGQTARSGVMASGAEPQHPNSALSAS
jgi:Mrp family chromosome partitioning ATPase